jgi:hypothetical protein
MSLLLEALKKAEKAKEEAQKRARQGEAEAAGELRLADDALAAPAAEERRVVTRDELPPITSPLEIQSEDISSAGARATEPAMPGAPRPAAGARAKADAQSAQRAAARKPFEAKMREPNPRLPFYLAMGALGAFALGTVIYFWIQLSPPQSVFLKDPRPASGEVAVAESSPPRRPRRGSRTPPGALPGLPGDRLRRASRAPPARKPRGSGAGVEPPRRRPGATASATAEASAARPVRAATTTRPQARVHPLVAAGYEAYQAGDMARARRDYESALADDRPTATRSASRPWKRGRSASPWRRPSYRRALQIDPRDPHAQAACSACAQRKATRSAPSPG